MNLLKNFTLYPQDDVDKIFEISESAEEKIYTEKESGLKWGCIKNFYKDPVAVKEFLQQFPIVEQKQTNSPGFQQHFSFPTMLSLKNVYEYLYEVIIKYNFPRGEENYSTEAWQTFCNLHWIDMKVSASNMIPHFDQPNMAFNIWLTEDNPAGTDFYYYQKDNEKPAYFFEQFAREEPQYASGFYRDVVNNLEDNLIDWDPNEIDNFYSSRGWHKYLTMEPEYNSVTFYPGIFFHKPAWDIRNYRKDLVRYSQVITYFFMPNNSYQMCWYDYMKSESF